MDQQKDIQYLKEILSKLVNNPKQIIIEKDIDDRGVLLTIIVAKSDMGVIIGKKGVAIHAIKRLLCAFGAKYNERISLRVLDPTL